MDSKSLTTKVNVELAKKIKKASHKKSSINDFITDFLGKFISKQTTKAYACDLRDFFDFLKTADVVIKSPNDITHIHFQFYRDHLIEKKLTSATVNRKLVAIRSFIKWAISLKLMDHNPLEAIKLPKIQTESPTVAFEDIEVTIMINSCDRSDFKGSVHRMIMVLLFNLGLRRQELVNIKIKDFFNDRGHNVLKIKGKGDKDRYLPISENLKNEISDYLENLQNFGIFLDKDDYLIQTKSKKKNCIPMDGSTIYRTIQKYAKLNNIDKKVSPHSCRATVISHLLDTQRTPIRDVATFAGHTNITTTERYDKRRENLDNSAAYDVDYFKSKVS